MKKKIKPRVLIAAVPLLLLLGGLLYFFHTAETREYEAQGLSFQKLEDLKGYGFQKLYEGEASAYVCFVHKANRSQLIIPDTFRDHPVVAVICDSEGDTLLKEVAFGSNVAYIERGFNQYTQLQKVHFPKSIKGVLQSFSGCPALQAVSFPGAVDIISDNSFCDCPSLQNLDFKSSISEIEEGCFLRCPLLTRVILPRGTQVGKDSFSEKTTILIGDKDAIAYSEQYSKKRILQHAKSVLGQEFSSSKEINPLSLNKFDAFQFNGPIVLMTRCADCECRHYSRQYVSEKEPLQFLEVYEVDADYPNTVYSYRKAQRVREGSDPVVYALCEQIGYIKGPDYSLGGHIADFLCYRISFHEEKSGKLVGWFAFRTGFAPHSFRLGDRKLTFTQQMTTGKKKEFFLEEDESEPTPMTFIQKYVFKGDSWENAFPSKKKTPSGNVG